MKIDQQFWCHQISDILHSIFIGLISTRRSDLSWTNIISNLQAENQSKFVSDIWFYRDSHMKDCLLENLIPILWTAPCTVILLFQIGFSCHVVWSWKIPNNFKEQCWPQRYFQSLSNQKTKASLFLIFDFIETATWKIAPL